MHHLCEKLLLVGLHVDVALGLGARGSELEADEAGGDTLMEFLERLDTTVLHGVLETSGEVGDELPNRSREGSVRVAGRKQVS